MKRLAFLLLGLVSFGCCAFLLMPMGKAETVPENTAVVEELGWMLENRWRSGISYANEQGPIEAKCDPEEFLELMKRALNQSSEEQRTQNMITVLSTFGFTMGEQSSFSPVGLTTVELVKYGQQPAPWGEARISVVEVYGSWGNNLYFIFIHKNSVWYITDCLVMDFYGIDSSNRELPLRKHWAGKPGIWLRTRTVGHGTGVYMDTYQWYNVFTKAFDLAYILEGYDSISIDGDMYYAGWSTDLGFTKDEVSDVLRFITYEGIVKNPNTNENTLGEEITSAMILFEYRYDPETCSYACAREERLPMMSPGSISASSFLRHRE